MVLLSVQAVRKFYGPEPVLAGVTFDARVGEKISLVGPNGAGKSTLMRILAGREDADAGTIAVQSSARFGYLEQHPQFDGDRTVWDEAHDALRELTDLSRQAEQLAQALADAEDEDERRQLGDQFDRIQQQLHHRDAYTLDHKIERVLQGLGFTSDTFRQPLRQLSGGQQNRLLLARLLLEEPDLLLLDEPSNHLDIEATQWLEEFLVASSQTVLVVSHDRYFLDRVTRRTLELFHGTIESYVGNYSAYRRQREERVEVQRRTYERQRDEIERMEEFIRRNHYGQKHAQAEDRRKKLERIERVDPPREITAPAMSFPPPTRTGDLVLRVERLAKSFDRSLFRDLTFDILRGEKWGILGPNGSGKTTLLRCLLGEQTPDAGHSSLGTGVRVGYFDQLLSCLDDDTQVIDAVRPRHKEFVEQQRRDLLARFGLTGEIVFQRVASLSGGERNRAALAMLAASDANFLVLDEPTNHLDLWARGALEAAVRAFEGTALFVSHDRYFLNQVADRLLVVEPDRFRIIEGNYDTYLHRTRQDLAESRQAELRSEKSNATNDQRRGNLRDGSTRRKRRFPYRKVAELEADIARAEQRIAELNESLASPDVFRDGARIRQVQAELQQLQEQLPQLYEHWEEASELNG